MNRNYIVIIILLLLFALGVSPLMAATLATMSNKAGGKIVLTDVKCKHQSGLVAYSSSPSQSTVFGCWFYDDQFVHITYSDGETRSYPKEGWFFPKTGVTSTPDAKPSI